LVPTLVEGLRRFRFDLLTVTDREAPSAPAYPLPLNVGSASAVQIGREPVRERRRGDANETGRGAAHLLCRGLIEERRFATGLRGLAELATERPDPLTGVPLADLLMDAWRGQAGLGRPAAAPARRPRRPAPRPRCSSTRSARSPCRCPRPTWCTAWAGRPRCWRRWPGRWRTGAPLLLTEARAPVARHRPAEERLSPAVRAVLRRFRAAVARTGYAEAGLIAPLSAYHHGWALRHGAEASRLVQVPAGRGPVGVPVHRRAEHRAGRGVGRQRRPGQRPHSRCWPRSSRSRGPAGDRAALWSG
jgi:hypothetical protein